MTLYDKGGGILNFVTSHLKNSIKVILHISYKLKQFSPRGKESTEVRITQNKGKESENSYQKLKRSRSRGTRTHTIPLKSIEHCTLNNLTNIHVIFCSFSYLYMI